jgi:hypothetical protein
VVSSYPLRAVLHNPNATGNIAKWATELAEFVLDFASRHVIKSQALADFIHCRKRHSFIGFLYSSGPTLIF